jgi:hypothetical protein
MSIVYLFVGSKLSHLIMNFKFLIFNFLNFHKFYKFQSIKVENKKFKTGNQIIFFLNFPIFLFKIKPLL